jgi:hypothetical protein
MVTNGQERTILKYSMVTEDRLDEMCTRTYHLPHKSLMTSCAGHSFEYMSPQYRKVQDIKIIMRSQ